MPYAVAWAVVYRRVGLAAVEESSVNALRDWVSLTVDQEPHYGARESRMVLETTGGDAYEHGREHSPGTSKDPLSLEKLRARYEMCAEKATDSAAVADQWDVPGGLQNHSSAPAFMNTS